MAAALPPPIPAAIALEGISKLTVYCNCLGALTVLQRIMADSFADAGADADPADAGLFNLVHNTLELYTSKLKTIALALDVPLYKVYKLYHAIEIEEEEMETSEVPYRMQYMFIAALLFQTHAFLQDFASCILWARAHAPAPAPAGPGPESES